MPSASLASLPPGVEYRHIEDYPGYAVGDDGTIWSCWRRGPSLGFNSHWHQLKGSKNKDGYRRLILCRGEERWHVCVHTLVLLAFVGPCPDGMEARHLNGVRTDNRATNLCWGTHIDNIMDNFRNGVRGPKMSVETAREIHQAILADGRSIKAIAERFGVSRCVVSSIKAGASWRHVQ